MVRFASPRLAVALLIGLGGFAAGSEAQEAAPSSLREAVAAAAIAATPADQPSVAPAARAQQRPAALLPLYISFGTLQLLDAHSTSRALAHGAVEANPLMKHAVGNTAGLIAVKAAGTAGVVLVGERMRKKHQAAAIVFMLATNSAMAWVVQHNYRAIR